MAYNKFKSLNQLEDDFGVQNRIEEWLYPQKKIKEISIFLKEALEEAKHEALSTEKAKSEYIIVPILKELKRNNNRKFSVFSGYQFDVDKQAKLTGFCDFILAEDIQKMTLKTPIFCLLEAKKGEIEEGLAQCGAEMYAAYLFNEREGKPREIIYGCVTNAFSWCFLKLQNKTLYIDPNYVPLTFAEPHPVLIALQGILEEALDDEKART